MASLQHLYFEHFQIDPPNAQLLQNGLPIPLTPKAYDVLAFLCKHHGRLVSKEELLDAVWQRRFVSEGVLKNTIQELRRALGDNHKSPRFIETIHRRGYRFIALIHGSSPDDAPSPQPIVTMASVPIVGRESLLHTLDQYLDMTLAGNPRTVFISGEPGIGKTALIQSFVQRAGSRGLCILGQCVEQYGQSEPYLPLLEAINQLARHDGEDCLRQLRQYAPTWLAQLPWLAGESEREMQGVTKHRMLRELGEFLQHRSEDRPLILIIEDMHWCERSTLDAIAYLSRRRDGAKLMILGSYRPMDVVVNEHPFLDVRNELLLHELCHELPLPPLALEDVAQYLRMRFVGDTVRESFIQAVFRRTEGLPLFLVCIADEMEMVPSGGIEQAIASLPDGLRHLICLQFDRFPPMEKTWLDVAAVCGDSFSAAVLAEVTGATLETVEAWCEKQVHAHLFLRHAFNGIKVEEHQTGYAFVHAYYQEQAYARIAPARKASLHNRIGAWIEATYASRTDDMAAELAVHFERGHHYESAVKYLHQAARNAMSRHAMLEAAHLLQHGIVLLEAHLPGTLENQRRRLEMQALLPSVLITTRGHAEAELSAIYNRTLVLAEQLEDRPVQYYTLYGIWMFRSARAELEQALALAKQLSAMAESSRDVTKQASACLAMGSTLMFMGQNSQANEWFERSLRFDEGLGSEDQLVEVFGQDLLAGQMSVHALSLHMLGHADQALGHMHAARNRAETIGHPYTQAFALFCTVCLHRDRAEPERVRDYLPRLEQLSAIHGFPAMINIARIFDGWVSATLDGDPRGAIQMRQAIEQMDISGARLTKAVYFNQLADAYLQLDRYEEGLDAAHSALEEISFSGERRHEAESYRLLGECLLRSEKDEEITPEDCFEKALSIARSQDAWVFELRAAMSLARVQRTAPQRIQGLQGLREICDRFTEGFDMPHLREALFLVDRSDTDIPPLIPAMTRRQDRETRVDSSRRFFP